MIILHLCGCDLYEHMISDTFTVNILSTLCCIVLYTLVSIQFQAEPAVRCYSCHIRVSHNKLHCVVEQDFS